MQTSMDITEKIKISKKENGDYWFIIIDGDKSSGIVLKEYDLVLLYRELKKDFYYIISREEGL